MPDREKVIKGLECCINESRIVPACEECPYCEFEQTCTRLDALHQDALELLKAQEPEAKHGKWFDECCSVCGQYVYSGDARNFCPHCGAKMDGGNENGKADY